MQRKYRLAELEFKNKKRFIVKHFSNFFVINIVVAATANINLEF